jgi:hypothetical protein
MCLATLVQRPPSRLWSREHRGTLKPATLASPNQKGAALLNPIGAKITEVEGSHVIMVSQPQAVADVILTAVADVG